MSLLLTHWSIDPLAVLVLALGVLYVVGLAAVRRSRDAAGGPTAHESWRVAAVAGGLALAEVGLCSPLSYWSHRYLFAHVIQHIVLAFFAPPLLVLGAPWEALRAALPVAAAADRTGGPGAAPRERARRRLGHPLVPLVAFNANMVVWHLPAVYDTAYRSSVLNDWGEHASFLVLGVWLWSQILDSPPLHPRWGPLGRAGVAFLTNAVMVGIAVTLVLFSHELYPVYAHQAHTLLSQYSDQQVAGSALWICGEFSLAPAIYYTMHLFLRDQPGSVGVPAAGAGAPWRGSSQRWTSVQPQDLEIGWTRPPRR